MLRHKKSAPKISEKNTKETQPGSSAFLMEHAGRSGMLVATPIRCAMHAEDLPNRHVLVRSFTSLEHNDLEGIIKRRGGESFKRNSGHRPESMVEIAESKRKSDPCSSSTFMSSVTSLKAFFGVNTDGGESLMFKRIGTTRPTKKAAADTKTRNVIPGLKRLPHDRSLKQKSPSPSALSSNMNSSMASSSKTSKFRKGRSRKRFISSTSKSASKDEEQVTSSDDEKVEFT